MPLFSPPTTTTTTTLQPQPLLRAPMQMRQFPITTPTTSSSTSRMRMRSLGRGSSRRGDSRGGGVRGAVDGAVDEVEVLSGGLCLVCLGVCGLFLVRRVFFFLVLFLLKI